MHDPNDPVIRGQDSVEGPRRIELKEERLRVAKQPGRTGTLRVSRRMIEHSETITLQVREERLVLECMPGSGPIRVGDRDLAEGETLEYTLMREQVTVNREPILEGGISLRKEGFERPLRIEEVLRREELVLAQSPSDATLVEERPE